ncbi:aminotransferase class I/II-fold pyridoxal phosphate-dependent enzyme [Maribacter sp. 2210JD10-5]|uniref:aminotransferase class I/II-fold pyridoxal phosphate-dependent enzyme n=1 Tax=Maribacter sp. 2210JD10-5 TaxID=3386272 RepID=UPI0039BCDC3B
MQQLPKNLENKLIKRSKENSLRNLGRTSGLIDFSSNDYLGFAHNETIFSKTFQLLLTENIAQNGATGSRLLTGNHKLYDTLEAKLAHFHEAESALVFNSGYDANVGFFGSVPQRGDVVFYDEFIHASIREGIGTSLAKNYKFRHNQLDDLKAKIDLSAQAQSTTQETNIYIVTESVFSMDGDTPDLKALAQFCKSNGYRLIIDEAHATGVLGKNGTGLVQELGLQKDVFARLVTFGKGIGAHGAAVLGSEQLKSYLVNYARSLIYSTGLSPHSIATAITAYEYLRHEGASALNLLKENIGLFREKIDTLGLRQKFINSESAIQSCIIPGNKKVKDVSQKLMEKGFDVKAILSPTVPEGEERLRFCLHSDNSKAEIGLVLELLAKYI